MPGDQLIIAVQRVHGVPDLLDYQLKESFPEVSPKWIEIDNLLPAIIHCRNCLNKAYLTRINRYSFTIATQLPLAR